MEHKELSFADRVSRIFPALPEAGRREIIDGQRKILEAVDTMSCTTLNEMKKRMAFVAREFNQLYRTVYEKYFVAE